jgi:putative SOS response-associated peptidase YedK
VPFWADDPSIGNRLINARSEEAASKPAFRAAMKSRRCLVPVSGFYEWQAIAGEKRKQPWYFTVKDAPLFAFAGLWESWSGGKGEKLPEPVETFTILTGKPNELVAPIHNRMPVIVRPEYYDRWLDAKATDPAALADVLEPFGAERMDAWKVSTRVNAPANQGPELAERTG